MKDKLSINIQSYRTDEAIEKYSNYSLYPNELLLFKKYFPYGSSVLDLACGIGRTTLRLYEMGYIVKGIDLSDVFINIARNRFPYISFDEGSYTNILEDDSSYDNVLISHNSLDYAYPESEREKAIKEVARVIKKDGIFILSSHNIKSLHFSPHYLRNRKRFLLNNIFHSFKRKKYILDMKMWTFFASPEYIINQIEKEGFILKELIGFKIFYNKILNKYFSPFIHYVFKKI
jgi:SAM-dependent methyltransferase